MITDYTLLAANCTPSDYVEFRDRHKVVSPLLPSRVDHPARLLANSYEFGCRGVVTQWDLYTVFNGSHPIELHVWRRNTTTNTRVYHLVGLNSFPNAQPDTDHLLSLPVPIEQRISVEPGDIVGIRTIAGSSQDLNNEFRVQIDFGGLHTQYFIDNENLPTPSTLSLERTRNVGLGLSPVINVTIDGELC